MNSITPEYAKLLTVNGLKGKKNCSFSSVYYYHFI